MVRSIQISLQKRVGLEWDKQTTRNIYGSHEKSQDI